MAKNSTNSTANQEVDKSTGWKVATFLLALFLLVIIVFFWMSNQKTIECSKALDQVSKTEEQLKSQVGVLQDSLTTLKATMNSTPEEIRVYYQDIIDSLLQKATSFEQRYRSLEQSINSGRLTISQSLDSLSYYKNAYYNLLSSYNSILKENAQLQQDNKELKMKLDVANSEIVNLRKQSTDVANALNSSQRNEARVKSELDSLQKIPSISYVSFRGLKSPKDNNCKRSQDKTHNTKDLNYFEVGIELRNTASFDFVFNYEIVNKETKQQVLNRKLTISAGQKSCYIHSPIPKEINIESKIEYELTIWCNGNKVGGTSLKVNKKVILF